VESPLRLGAFYLQEPIGQGGMGEVWRGYHPQQNVPVAVKVMVAEQARSPRALTAFRREVRAIASLHHPSIVSVLDHGVISTRAARESAGRLVAGSPYLVMELAEDTLATRPPAFDWREIHGVLVALLDALAHAHANGIVHRDLKPANALWVRRGVGYPARLKLSDFGLAHVVAHLDLTRGRGAGTPSYMAPEQFAGAVRDFGPWTDLYALGCLAYHFGAGRRPFETRDEQDLARLHLHHAPDPFVPACSVPEGFDAWVMRLLEKKPLRRFRCAADAAYALSRLGDPAEDDPVVDLRTTSEFQVGSRERSGTRVGGSIAVRTTEDAPPSERGSGAEGEAEEGERTELDRPPVTLETILGGDSRGDLDGQGAGVRLDAISAPPLPVEPPPLPETWRGPEEPLPTQLIGAGLGLYGLRAIPLEGREAERDVLWDALRRVGARNRPELVVLRGPSGYGKTRLAEWFAVRALELGGAISLAAQHEPHLPSGAGVARMVAEHLRTRGLAPEEARERIRRTLLVEGVSDPYEWQSLTELVAPPSEASEKAMRLMQPNARYALVTRMLERLGSERPVVVRLEDVQWGADSLAFVAHVLDHGQVPVLFVLTVQDEALVEHSIEAIRLGNLGRREDARVLPVGPLPDRAHRRLVAGLLRLDGALTDAIAQRTAGNPLFAIQLVRDWVQRGVLALSEEGFALREGEQAIFPDDLYAIWSARIDRFVADDPHVRAALEIAAVSGRTIDMGEWEASCAAAGLTLPSGFLESLLTNRIVSIDDAAFYEDAPNVRFVHGMLRECLERQAAEGGRLAELHSAAADALLPRFLRGQTEVAERLGVHLQEAERLAAALEPLRVAALRNHERADYDRELTVLDMHLRVADRMDLSVTDHERVLGLLARAELLWSQGELAQASEVGRVALDRAIDGHHEILIPRAQYIFGYVEAHRGNLDAAEELLVEALQAHDRQESELEAARCLRGLAHIAHARGQLKVAFDAYLHSLELCRRHDDHLAMTASLVGMAHSNPYDEQTNTGFLEEALALSESVGDLYGVGRVINYLGDTARHGGRPEEATSLYRRALEIDQQIGATFQEAIVATNLALVAIGRGDYFQARHILDTRLAAAETKGQAGLRLLVHAARAASAMGLGEPRGFDRHLDVVARTLAERPLVDADVAWALEKAGDLAGAHDDTGRAHQAWLLAADQWERCGRDDRMVEIGAKLGPTRRSEEGA